MHMLETKLIDYYDVGVIKMMNDESGKLVIRKARLDDVRLIVNLNHALFQEDAGQRDPYMNLNWPKENGYKHFTDLIDGENSVCFLANADGRAVGYIAGYLREKSDLRPVVIAEIESIYLKEGFRGRGLGKKLTKKFINWGMKNGAERASVTAYSKNTDALNFYRKLGFETWETKLEVNVRTGPI